MSLIKKQNCQYGFPNDIQDCDITKVVQFNKVNHVKKSGLSGF